LTLTQGRSRRSPPIALLSDRRTLAGCLHTIGRMTSLRILLVDDHEIMRLGVRDFLALFPGYEVVGEAATGRDALKALESSQANAVIMDVVLPDMDGVVATRELLRRRPQTRVLMLSAYGQSQDVADAMNAGALGYVRKEDSPEILITALEEIAHGRHYLAPELASRYAAIATAEAPPGPLALLSEREREIFRLAADCRVPSEIAGHLCLARKTVDTHLNRIYRKLGLHSRAELVRMAAGLGLVHTMRRPPVAAPRNGVGGGDRHRARRASRV
jgi:DNA-binding NarL/FixJ family response regulator